MALHVLFIVGYCVMVSLISQLLEYYQFNVIFDCIHNVCSCLVHTCRRDGERWREMERDGDRRMLSSSCHLRMWMGVSKRKPTTSKLLADIPLNKSVLKMTTYYINFRFVTGAIQKYRGHIKTLSMINQHVKTLNILCQINLSIILLWA